MSNIFSIFIFVYTSKARDFSTKLTCYFNFTFFENGFLEKGLLIKPRITYSVFIQTIILYKIIY